MWPFGWLRKQKEKHETVEDVYKSRGIDTSERPTVRGVRGRVGKYLLEPMPAPPSGDFMTGFLVAEALSGGNAEAGLIGGAIGGVSGGIIAGELIGHESPASEPVTFGGGESGGAGASGSYDTPSCDTSSSSSSDSSSSSCDSSSSDSGSLSSDF